MNKYYYFFTTLLFATSACSAMEPTVKNSNPNFIMTITTIKDPRAAFWIDNKVVAILGKYGCSLYDTVTKSLFKQITSASSTFQCMVQHPNKKLLAIVHNQNLQIYDTEKNDTIYKKDFPRCCNVPAFNPTDNTILIANRERNGVHSFNYCKNDSDDFYAVNNSEHSSIINIEYHPTEQECILCSSILQVLQFNKDPYVKKDILLNLPMIGFNKYSPDGKLIAISCHEFGCVIVKRTSNSEVSLPTNWLKGDKNDQPCAMQFHPTSSILAILPQAGKYICYWNATTQELITTTPLPTVNGMFYYDPNYSLDQRIDFSVDGTKVIVIRTLDCFILRVPFEVLSGEPYKLGTKNKCAFTLWALQNYIHEGDMLPQEITQLLTYNLFLATPKF